jgi:hypothetical protein
VVTLIEVWSSVAEKYKNKIEVLHELVANATESERPQSAALRGVGKYANMQTTPAVLAVIESSSQALATIDIIRILENEGFDTKSKHWKAAVFTACGRLASKGTVMALQRNGKAAYMRKATALASAK